MKAGLQTFGIAALILAGAAALAQPLGASNNDDGDQAPGPVANATVAAPSKIAQSQIDYAAFDRRLERLAAKRSMVGLAVGIIENGRVTFLKGYGETEAGNGEPVTPETVFRWASVSKGVAGTVAAKLDADGKLALDAPIARYSASLLLPGGAQTQATVRDVLSHRLGLWRNAYDDRLEDGQDPRDIRRSLGELVLTCPPGTCWSYQNVAFDSVSEAVEKATGKPYRDVAQALFFNPIGMDSASMTSAGLTGSKSWARPHNAGRRPLKLTESYYRVPAAGGVNSDIKDMALWLEAQMGLLPDILPEPVLETAHEALVRTPTEVSRMRKYRERVHDPYYGLGWRSYDYEGHHIIGHRGGVNGYRSLILFDPQLKTGVVALWNSNASQPTGLQFELLDMAYGLSFRDWMELDRG